MQPITLGDLKKLAQDTPVEKIRQHASGVKSALKAGGESHAAASMTDDFRASAKLREARSPNKYLGRLNQVSKRLARLQHRRPVQNAPSNFMPV